jgi:hypothetical protein
VNVLNWLRNIARTGIKDSDEYQVRRGILLSNYISLILIGALTLLYIVRRTYFASMPGGISLLSYLLGIIAFITPILSNKAGFTTFSRIILCYAPVVFIWVVAIKVMWSLPQVVQASYDSVRILFLAVSFIPYLLLDSKKPFLLIMGILPNMLSLLFFDFTLSQFGLGREQHGVVGSEAVLIGSRTFVAYCIISLGCFIFRSIVTYNDELNKVILTELREKSEEIKAQNEELVQSQERLNEINLHLEELVTAKTASIQQQHEKLLHYAYANAHHVRGPVARLLGLIQLSRIKTDLEYPWFFEKVEKEVHDVDVILKGIAHELDEITRLNEEQKS